jgi:regulator of protease activity HflC (stomatin/prohibitin superfamily)
MLTKNLRCPSNINLKRLFSSVNCEQPISWKLQDLDYSSKFNFGVQIVQKDSVRIVERFGDFDRILKPGLNFLNPISERIVYTHSLKEILIPIKVENIIINESHNISILGNLTVKVTDPIKLSYNILQPYSNLCKIVNSAIHLESEKYSIREFMKLRNNYNNNIDKHISSKINDWGLFASYEVEKIIQSDNYLEFVDNRIKLDQHLEEKIVKHRQDIEISEYTSNSEASSIENIANVKASSIKTVSEAEALAVITKANAELEKAKIESKAFKILNSTEDAVKFALAKEMIEAWKILAKQGPTVLMSGNPSNISRAVAEALSTYDAIKKI